MHRATLKGYNVLGKRYYPQIMPIGWRETGVASWYGSDFHGKKTSNGETYDMYAPGTAAHKTLPMNTILLVTRKDTGAQVKVRVNDRGPFIAGRIIDLSYTAGKAIGLDKAGTAMVTIEVIEYDSYISSQLGLKNQRFTYTVSAGETKSQTAAKTNGYALQLGSFKSLDWANKLKTDSVPKAGGKDVVIKTVSFGREKIHRVLIGEFDTKEEAIRFKNENGFSSAVVVSVS
jgi:rare lipoprotein A